MRRIICSHTDYISVQLLLVNICVRHCINSEKTNKKGDVANEFVEGKKFREEVNKCIVVIETVKQFELLTIFTEQSMKK
jgi:hypothetical protein